MSRRKNILFLFQCAALLFVPFSLVSCEDKAVEMYKEVQNVEKQSLEKDYCRIATTIESSNNDKDLSLKVNIDCFQDSDFGACYFFDTIDSEDDYYFIGNYRYKYYYKSVIEVSEVSNSNQMLLEETLESSLSKCSKDTKNGIATYTLTFSDFEDLFNKFTDYEYTSKENDIVFEDNLVLTIGVKDALIAFEECTMHYEIDGNDCSLHIRMDCSYIGEARLPTNVKDEAYKNKNTEDLLNFDTEFVREINHTTDSDPLKASDDYLYDYDGRIKHYFYDDDFSYRVVSDYQSYLLAYRINKPYSDGLEKLFVYDLKTLQLQYSVVFKGQIRDVICENGKAAISLHLYVGKFSRYSGYSCYSLTNFSKITNVPSDTCLMYGDKLFYPIEESKQHLIRYIDLTDNKVTTLAACNDESPYPLILDVVEESSILIAYHQENKTSEKGQDNHYHYFAFNALTTAKIYEKHIDRRTFNYWTGRGDKGNYINVITGDDIYYEGNPKIDYNIANISSDCFLSEEEPRYINSRYDVIKVGVRYILDEYYHTDMQYWIYDTTNSGVVCQIDWVPNQVISLSEQSFLLCRTKKIMVVSL